MLIEMGALAAARGGVLLSPSLRTVAFVYRMMQRLGTYGAPKLHLSGS